MQKVFDCGIDLGTTNSCLAIPGETAAFDIVENQQDRMKVTPSAVEINARKRITVGQRAYNSQHPEDLAVQFKRQMGTSTLFHFASADIDKTPEELSAEVLMRIRADAEARLMRNVENVVITVPAAFKALQTEATNRSGKSAGFKNIILLQEPIAAAIAYGAKPDTSDKSWMVFDYGGGTLDVAIVSTENNRLEVVSSEGDNYFGGSDIDRLMFENIIKPKIVQAGYSVNRLFDEQTPSGRSVVRSILLKCEYCKISLSSQEVTVFELFDLDDDKGDPIEFECNVKRIELEKLILPSVEKSIEIAKKALSNAKAKVPSMSLDKILLVGGSTYIPLVRQKLQNEFKVELDCSLDPMTVVAGGAAVYAASSVIDVEDIVAPTEKGNAVVSLTYEPVSPAQNVNIIGKILNPEEVDAARVRVDCAKSIDFSGAIWTSGWVDMLDKESGIFDVDVLLQPNQLNHFKLFICDSHGSDIPVENGTFDIKHTEASKVVGAPTATNSIGVKVWNSEIEADELDVLVKKDDSLPSGNVRTYKTNRVLDPDENDEIRIEIFEGENISNPEANHSAGTIFLKSTAMKYRVPKGTEVEITIEQDINRNIHVSGYIPDFEYEIPQATLRPAAEEDLRKRFSALEDRMEAVRELLDELKGKGVDISSLEDELGQLEEQYNEMEAKIGSDDGTVSHYIDYFYDFETDVKRRLRASKQDVTADHSEKIKKVREEIYRNGTAEEKEQMSQLEEDYAQATTQTEKQHIVQQMNSLESESHFNNFDWLRSSYLAVFANDRVPYKNPSKVSYWKREAESAIRSHNVFALRHATLQLIELADFGTSSQGASMAAMADLMK